MNESKKEVVEVKKEDKKVRKPSAWMVHVGKYRDKHPKLSYKECLINAAKTYKKKADKTKTKTKVKTEKVKTKKTAVKK